MKKLVGLFASVALMTSGAALAQGGQQVDQSSQSQGSSTQSGEMGGYGGSGSSSQQGSMGGSGSMGGAQGQMGTSAQMGANQLTGQVLKSEKSNVYIKQADGAVVSLKVDKKTQFTDPSVKSAKNLQPGQEIRASFKVQGTDNIATSIEPSSGGMGGSGAMTPDTGINQPMQQPSQGSSGMEKGGSGSDISGSQQQQGGEKNY